MTLIDPEGQFRKYMHSLLFSSLIKSRQSDKICRRPCVTFKGHFRYYKRFHCLYIKYTTYVWGQLQHCHMSYASNYFYCLIQPECLNLIVIAKFLVTTPWATKMCRWIFVHNSWEMLANFKNSFTVGLGSKFATRRVTYFPPHLKCVTTLLCEIQKKLQQFNWHI